MKKSRKIAWTVVVSLILIALVAGFGTLRHQALPITEDVRVNIPQGSTYQALVDSMDAHGCIVSRTAFNTIAGLRGLPDHVKAGSYLFHPGTGIIRVIQKLYSGNQDAVRVTINKHRTDKDLCQFLSGCLTFHADSLLSLMRNDSACALYGETPASIIGMFLQNTYEYYWTISPSQLLERMHKESEHFWKSRNKQLEDMGLTKQQVLTIASIVEEETNDNDEKPDIASVYLNRYRIGMPLQADPTVKFAIGDFSIRRIKSYMLSIDNPYNTYRYAGLPPGPICIPSTKSIDAVLKNKKTDYLFFCAKEDFSGKHNFAATNYEHTINAQRFHKALNDKNIH